MIDFDSGFEGATSLPQPPAHPSTKSKGQGRTTVFLSRFSAGAAKRATTASPIPGNWRADGGSSPNLDVRTPRRLRHPGRSRISATGILLVLASILHAQEDDSLPPNIVLVIADDLGIGEVGAYGQTRIRAPHLGRLSREGVLYTNAYAGAPVCAPSRCTLLTGFHTGHAAIRDNHEVDPEGQCAMPAETVTLAALLKAAGYATGAVGKWGLGPPGSVSAPAPMGFDQFFGYLCQRHAHNHFPAYLWRNETRVELVDSLPRSERGGLYAPDLFLEEARKFWHAHRGRPRFLLYATPIPHAALQVPEDSLSEYAGEFPEVPYDGKKGYVPHSTPRAAYAAMVTRMDRDLGQFLEFLAAEGDAKRTLVLFTSDNGPTYNGGTDSQFFSSAQGRRGLKGQLFEGGIRVPLIVRWPSRVPAGSKVASIVANWDLFPTLLEAAGVPTPLGRDGVSLIPAMTGGTGPSADRHLYWEYSSGGGSRAVRFGRWKAIQLRQKQDPKGATLLFDLDADPNETTDLAARHPEVVRHAELLLRDRTPAGLPSWEF